MCIGIWELGWDSREDLGTGDGLGFWFGNWVFGLGSDLR